MMHLWNCKCHEAFKLTSWWTPSRSALKSCFCESLFRHLQSRLQTSEILLKRVAVDEMSHQMCFVQPLPSCWPLSVTGTKKRQPKLLLNLLNSRAKAIPTLCINLLFLTHTNGNSHASVMITSRTSTMTKPSTCQRTYQERKAWFPASQVSGNQWLSWNVSLWHICVSIEKNFGMWESHRELKNKPFS